MSYITAFTSLQYINLEVEVSPNKKGPKKMRQKPEKNAKGKSSQGERLSKKDSWVSRKQCEHKTKNGLPSLTSSLYLT